MFVGPVTHVLCDLSTQERIRDARRDGAARAAGRRRSIVDRLRGRDPRPRDVDGGALTPAGEDLAHALRY